MRIIIIGGTGHVGTFLVPRLVALGHEVVCISRGAREPYQPHAAWRRVRRIVLDRKTEDQAGTFAGKVRDLRPDAVVDMICFEPESNRQLVEALRGHVQHFLHCGTIWIHGHSEIVPTVEEHPRQPIDDYGRKKNQIEQYLIDEARRNGFPATALHPGHIVGPGWVPVNPAGNFDPKVFTALARGDELALPNFGLETVHHVHADDVAQVFQNALTSWSAAVGESFHVVSPAALTLRGYARAVAGWFAQEVKLRFMPFDQWKETVEPRHADATYSHIAHSPNASIAKARRLLDYRPRYTSLQAVYEAVMWGMEHGLIEAP